MQIRFTRKLYQAINIWIMERERERERLQFWKTWRENRRGVKSDWEGVRFWRVSEPWPLKWKVREWNDDERACDSRGLTSWPHRIGYNPEIRGPLFKLHRSAKTLIAWFDEDGDSKLRRRCHLPLYRLLRRETESHHLGLLHWRTE